MPSAGSGSGQVQLKELVLQRFHTADGEKIYIAAYPGKGLILKMGEKAKPSFITTGMGVRLGTKLMQISNEARFPRI